MKDYRIQAKIKNNRILERLELLGYSNVNQFCLANNLSPVGIGELINMKRPALLKDGSWCSDASRMAEALKCFPGDLFSEAQKTVRLRRNAAEATYSEAQIAQLASNNPETMLIEGGLNDSIMSALETLTAREKDVLVMRFDLDGNGQRTLREIGKKYHVVPDRIRQIQEKALRKLRQKGRANILNGLSTRLAVLEDYKQ